MKVFSTGVAADTSALDGATFGARRSSCVELASGPLPQPASAKRQMQSDPQRTASFLYMFPPFGQGARGRWCVSHGHSRVEKFRWDSPLPEPFTPRTQEVQFGFHPGCNRRADRHIRCVQDEELREAGSQFDQEREGDPILGVAKIGREP